MFSKLGFSAVSVRDICYAVGVRESALYKHYSSKQAVFDTIVENYGKISDEFMSGIGALYGEDMSVMTASADRYAQMSDEEFLRIGGSVFTDFLMRPPIMKFWRMISIERCSDPKMAEYYHRQLFEMPMQFQTLLFGILIANGAMRDVDPSILALEFYSPLLMLYTWMLPFESDDEVFTGYLALARQHMMHFRGTYEVKHKKQEEMDNE